MSSAAGGLGQSLAGAAGALLAVRVSGTDAAAGLPQAALVVGSAAAALVLSGIARRYSRRASLAVGHAAASSGCIVVVFAAAGGSLIGVLVGSLLLGAGNTAVMLARYAAADLVGSNNGGTPARAMASVLVATTIGAVLGPNLLATASTLTTGLGMLALSGPYLLAALAFAAATATLMTGLPTERSAAEPTIAVPPEQTRLRHRGTLGLAVLGVANLTMVAVMTMAPIQLHHLGHGLTTIGIVISLHIAAMFAPSPISGWLTDRLGTYRAATIAGACLMGASVLAAAGTNSLAVLSAAMILLGAGWNVALIAGSVLLTAAVPAAERPRREGWGEISMGVAAAGGGIAAGPIVAQSGYATLAVAGALTAGLLIAVVLSGPTQRRS